MIGAWPTRRGLALTLSTLAAVGTALVNVSLTTGLAAAALCGLTLSSFILAFLSLSKVRLERAPSGDGYKGDRIPLPVVIVNESNRRRQAIVISEKIPFAENPILNTVATALAPRESRVIERWAWAARRGCYELRKVSLIGGDPAGLFYREKRFQLPRELMVYPENVRVSNLRVRAYDKTISFSAGNPLGVSGLGQEFFGVREYRPTDGVRFIHWKATARTRQLMVKEFEANAVTRVDIILDTEKRHVGDDPLDNNFEFLVTTAAAIANYLSSMYCQLYFTTGFGTGLNKIRGEAVAVRRQVINMLTMVRPTGVSLEELIDTELNQFQPNSALFCLTLSNPEYLKSRFDFFREKGVETHWVFAPRKGFPRIAPGGKTVVPEFNATGDAYGVTPLVASRGMSVARLLNYEG